MKPRERKDGAGKPHRFSLPGEPLVGDLAGKSLAGVAEGQLTGVHKLRILLQVCCNPKTPA